MAHLCKGNAKENACDSGWAAECDWLADHMPPDGGVWVGGDEHVMSPLSTSQRYNTECSHSSYLWAVTLGLGLSDTCKYTCREHANNVIGSSNGV